MNHTALTQAAYADAVPEVLPEPVVTQQQVRLAECAV